MDMDNDIDNFDSEPISPKKAKEEVTVKEEPKVDDIKKPTKPTL